MPIHQTFPSSLRTITQTHSHLMLIVIQDPVLDWCEGCLAGGEGRSVNRSVGGRIPPGSCRALILLLDPVESHRPAAFSAQKKDAQPTEDHQSPDHIR